MQQTKSQRVAEKRRLRPAASKSNRAGKLRDGAVSSVPMLPPDWVDAGEPWYVLRATTRREKAAEKELLALGCAVWLPRVKVCSVTRGVASEAERALFPGYLLMRIGDDERAELFPLIGDVEKIARVGLGVVGVSDGEGRVRPSRLPRRFMSVLLERLGAEARSAEVKPAERVLGQGDSVRVAEGPFAGFVGVVERVMPELGRLVIEAEMFGSPQPLHLDLAAVQRL